MRSVLDIRASILSRIALGKANNRGVLASKKVMNKGVASFIESKAEFNKD
jgi:hypothetical protein